MNKGLQLKYFVLKPRGTDEYAIASRKALQSYARSINDINPELASDLLEWCRIESVREENFSKT